MNEHEPYTLPAHTHSLFWYNLHLPIPDRFTVAYAGIGHEFTRDEILSLEPSWFGQPPRTSEAQNTAIGIGEPGEPLSFYVGRTLVGHLGLPLEEPGHLLFAADRNPIGEGHREVVVAPVPDGMGEAEREVFERYGRLFLQGGELVVWDADDLRNGTQTRRVYAPGMVLIGETREPSSAFMQEMAALLKDNDPQ